MKYRSVAFALLFFPTVGHAQDTARQATPSMPLAEITVVCHLYFNGPTKTYEPNVPRQRETFCLASSGLSADTFFHNQGDRAKAGVVRVFVAGGPVLKNLKVGLYRGGNASEPGPEVTVPFQRMSEDKRPGWHFEPVPPGTYVVVAQSDNTNSNVWGVTVRPGDAYYLFIVLTQRAKP